MMHMDGGNAIPQETFPIDSAENEKGGRNQERKRDSERASP